MINIKEQIESSLIALGQFLPVDVFILDHIGKAIPEKRIIDTRRNPGAVDTLIEDSAEAQALIAGLFDRYVMIELRVLGYQLQEQTVSAMLTLNSMVLMSLLALA